MHELVVACKAVLEHFHSLAIAIFIKWYIGSLTCDLLWGFCRSPTPRHISKRGDKWGIRFLPRSDMSVKGMEQ